MRSYWNEEDDLNENDESFKIDDEAKGVSVTFRTKSGETKVSEKALIRTVIASAITIVAVISLILALSGRVKDIKTIDSPDTIVTDLTIFRDTKEKTENSKKQEEVEINDEDSITDIANADEYSVSNSYLLEREFEKNSVDFISKYKGKEMYIKRALVQAIDDNSIELGTYGGMRKPVSIDIRNSDAVTNVESGDIIAVTGSVKDTKSKLELNYIDSEKLNKTDLMNVEIDKEKAIDINDVISDIFKNSDSDYINTAEPLVMKATIDELFTFEDGSKGILINTSNFKNVQAFIKLNSGYEFIWKALSERANGVKGKEIYFAGTVSLTDDRWYVNKDTKQKQDYYYIIIDNTKLLAS